MHKLAKWTSTLLLTLAATNVAAAPIEFQYSGTCSTNCGQLGLGAGGSITGSIFTDTDAFADNIVSLAEITNFDFTFGNAIFNALTGIITSASLTLNAAQDAFVSGTIQFRNSAPIEIAVANESVDLWRYQPGPGQAQTSGSGAFAAVPAAAVPEPGMIALLSIGLLAGAGLRRKAATR